MHFVATITVDRPVEDVYGLWRDFRNFPRFMTNVESIEEVGRDESHWVATGPGGARVEWDAVVTDDSPNELIAWESLEGADVKNSGCVRFADADGGGTEITLEIDYAVPGGVIGETAVKLAGEDPEAQVREDLQRFKQVIEGEPVS